MAEAPVDSSPEPASQHRSMRESGLETGRMHPQQTRSRTLKVKTTFITALAASLLAASTLGAAAQDPSSGASYFTLLTSCSEPPFEGEPGEPGDGWETFVGKTFTNCTVDAGDPRATGILNAEQNYTIFESPDGIIEINQGTYRLINDEGTWVGHGTITMRQEDGPPSPLAGLWTFVGEDGYEGLTLEWHAESPRPEEANNWGVIYPTEATPPMPEPIAAD